MLEYQVTAWQPLKLCAAKRKFHFTLECFCELLSAAAALSEDDSALADELYRKAYFRTDNGIALLEIEEIIGKIECEDCDE